MDVIFDIIGYWGAVSIVTISLLYGVTCLSVLLLDVWVNNITDGEYKHFIVDKISDICNLDIFDPHDAAGQVMSGVSSIISLIIFLLVGYTAPKLQTISYVEMVNNLAVKLAPVCSWLISAVGVLLLVHWLSKKGYVLCKAIKDLQEKVK